jgi:hypothetical protein
MLCMDCQVNVCVIFWTILIMVRIWNGELSSIPWIDDNIVFNYISSCCGGWFCR